MDKIGLFLLIFIYILLMIADSHQLVHTILDLASDCFNFFLYLEPFLPEKWPLFSDFDLPQSCHYLYHSILHRLMAYILLFNFFSTS